MYKIARDNTVVKVIKDWHIQIGWSSSILPVGTTVILKTYDDRTHEYLVNFGSGRKWFQRKADWLHRMEVEGYCEMEEEKLDPLGTGSFGSFIDHTINSIQREWRERVLHTTTQSLTGPELDQLKEILFNFLCEKIKGNKNARKEIKR